MSSVGVTVAGVVAESVGDALLLRTTDEDREPLVRLMAGLPPETDRVAVVSTVAVSALPQFFVLLPRILGAELGGSVDGVRLVPLGGYAPMFAIDRAVRGVADRIGREVLVPLGPYLPQLPEQPQWLRCLPGAEPGPAPNWPTPPPELPGTATPAGWSFLETAPTVTAPSSAGFVVEVAVGPTGFRVAGRLVPPATLATLVATARGADRRPVVLVISGSAPGGPAAGLLLGTFAGSLDAPVLIADAVVAQAADGSLTTSGSFHRWVPRPDGAAPELVGPALPGPDEAAPEPVGPALPKPEKAVGTPESVASGDTAPQRGDAHGGVVPYPQSLSPQPQPQPQSLSPDAVSTFRAADQWQIPAALHPDRRAVDAPVPVEDATPASPAELPVDPAPEVPVPLASPRPGAAGPEAGPRRPTPYTTPPPALDQIAVDIPGPLTVAAPPALPDTGLDIPAYHCGEDRSTGRADARTACVPGTGLVPTAASVPAGGLAPGEPETPLWLGEPGWGADDRARLRQVLNGRYDGYARTVTRILAEEPGLRAATASADTVAGLVALCAYVDGDRDEVNRTLRAGGERPGGPDRQLVARGTLDGLRRLPAVLGPVHVVSQVTPELLYRYRPGDELVEPAFVDVDLAPPPVPEAAIEFAIWSVSAHRIDRIGPDAMPGALFPPGTRFAVLGVDPPDGAGQPARVLLRDLAGSRPGTTRGNDRILDRLRRAAAAPVASTPGRFLPFAPGLDGQGRCFAPPYGGPVGGKPDAPYGGARP